MQEIYFELKVDEDIVLKLRNQNHLKEMFEITKNNIDRLKPWLSWATDSIVIEETEAFIQRSQEGFLSKKSLDLGIFYQGKLIGSAGFHGMVKSDRKAAIGYWVDKNHEGQGIVTKSMRCLIEYGFGELDLNRLEILCGEGNKESRAVAERLGFVLEGKMRQYHIINGVMIDDLIFSLLKEDFLKNKN